MFAKAEVGWIECLPYKDVHPLRYDEIGRYTLDAMLAEVEKRVTGRCTIEVFDELTTSETVDRMFWTRTYSKRESMRHNLECCRHSRCPYAPLSVFLHHMLCDYANAGKRPERKCYGY